ncbi:MFS transporter [Mycolicibacterium fortuitum]|uniref:Drug efflux membrane protein n=1 Tax=Mycolicibacterium fortuitum subsp. fortuitum DSM 46621 = ATCC 6841 = JCM 6387 TaxID=1214102 RepID=K0VQF0_MYCFO|nr:MFS transporter [Mycolicibacterium fortuitum]AIY47028.1 Multidrug resistance protein B [Mycobacterium sp. VKM Ac-1817D]CRL76776.1 drug efflux membrane protein [Mycolicibacter nonchromogenicus]AMD55103.1 MFS transporter [Mycolicibacterium fortuitum subsp. fortuitum DSM 46621 = ATCC 6841 = JCM 6387]EJZ13514.1 drug efflux membrane protein [Mycolicibacterium fortuitum subsp. fortuitum DSM 46621 = ATCC 6841 = JCM 6387]WEV30511.1 MFS transporter [Mycolicibacterium fortuitum]
MTETLTPDTGTWRQLLGARYLGASTVLAGGVLLYATNEFLTISLLPSAVSDIGGQRFYAWVTTVYLVASVVAATTVHSLLIRLGPRLAYLLGLSVFAAGSSVCALAPSMEALLAGRTVQGSAGGLLAGLGYAVINTALPNALWTKASALVSAMWGVGTVIGPAAGGLFAQFGHWRWAFGILVVLAAAMAVLVPVALPARGATSATTPGIPVWSLAILGAAAMSVSVAGIPHDWRATAALLTLGVALVVAFLAVDRRAGASVLPPSTFGPGPLKWIYLSLGVLMAATMVDMYVPLFGQRLGHLSPVTAGFFGAVLSVGWTAGEIVSASLQNRRVITRTVAFAPIVMAAGLAAGAVLIRDGMSPWLVIAWAAALVVTGAGIGIAWPHLSAWAMSRVDDPAEGPAAAAAINTVQLICGAVGAGLAGVVVNLSDTAGAAAARGLFTAFAVLAVVGAIASFRSDRAR